MHNKFYNACLLEMDMTQSVNSTVSHRQSADIGHNNQPAEIWISIRHSTMKP